MTARKPAAYLKISGITFIACLVFLAIFNWIVDPVGMFRIVEIQGFNKKKPEFYTHLRMTKAHAVRILKPDSIILGTSRAEYGLDPAHGALHSHRESIPYNLALSSCRIFEALQYLKHAHAVNPLKQAIIGLDMFMFNDAVKNEQDFDESRLVQHSVWNISMGWLHDIVISLISYKATMKSLYTIQNQNRKDLILYRIDGMRDDRYAWPRIQSKGGHRKVDLDTFRVKNPLSKETKGEKPFKMNNSIEYFRKLVHFCRINDVRLHLFISPVHARFLERQLKNGRYRQMEQWKREIVHAATFENSKDADKGIVHLWDFSGYNSITTEPFPRLGDTRTQMKWFWESTHYKKETGNLIMDRMFGMENPKRRVPEDFGIKLNLDIMEKHLERIRNKRMEYVGSHREDLFDIWKAEQINTVNKNRSATLLSLNETR